jgi:hypothetical protein
LHVAFAQASFVMGLVYLAEVLKEHEELLGLVRVLEEEVPKQHYYFVAAELREIRCY